MFSTSRTTNRWAKRLEERNAGRLSELELERARVAYLREGLSKLRGFGVNVQARSMIDQLLRESS